MVVIGCFTTLFFRPVLASHTKSKMWSKSEFKTKDIILLLIIVNKSRTRTNNTIFSLKTTRHWAGDSPLQHRDLPHPPRWSPTPPLHAPPPRGCCRKPRNGTRASSPVGPPAQRQSTTDRSHPHDQRLWFCLCWSPERKESHVLYLFYFQLITFSLLLLSPLVLHTHCLTR